MQSQDRILSLQSLDMGSGKKHHLSTEMADLLVKINQKTSNNLAILMRELISHRDMESMLTLGECIKNSPAGHLNKEVQVEAMFAPAGWGFHGSAEEKKFEEDWLQKWAPSPSMALEALVGQMLHQQNIQAKDRVIDPDRMIALIDMATPLTQKKGCSPSSVFSVAVKYLIPLLDISNENTCNSVVSVLKKIISIDENQFFRIENSIPFFDLSKRPLDAKDESAAGLTFKIESENLLHTLYTKNLSGRHLFFDALEAVYSKKLLNIEGLDFINTVQIDFKNGPGPESDILSRGWLDKNSANILFSRSVEDVLIGENGKKEAIESLYAVALAKHSQIMKIDAENILDSFLKSGVDINRILNCPNADRIFHGSIIHFAVISGSPDFVSKLIRSGADTKLKITSSEKNTGIKRGKIGFTALELAAFELGKLGDHQDSLPAKKRLEAVVSVLRSQQARAAANQLLEEMDLDNNSMDARETIGHAKRMS